MAAFTAWQQAYLQSAKNRFMTVDDIAQELQLNAADIQSALDENGYALPTPGAELRAREADAAKAAGQQYQLTPDMQALLGKAEMPTVQDAVYQARLAGNQSATIARTQRILEAAGQPMPATRGSYLAQESQKALDAGATRQLGAWEQKQYDRATENQWSAQQLADVLQEEYSNELIKTGQTAYDPVTGVPVTADEVTTILKGAGLALTGRQPGREPGTKPTQPAMNPQAPEYEGGLPGRQPQGGMYGISLTVPQGAGEVPRLPGLRGVFRQARRAQGAGYKGQTDTILTSARGILKNPTLRRRYLTKGA